MKDYWKEPQIKKVNKKKIIIAIIIAIIVIALITITILYINKKEVRTWIDKNIFQKEKTQNNLPSIEIEEDNNSNIYAFNKNIGILNKNNFSIYDNTGKKEKELTIEISKPIFNNNNRYTAIAEEKGQKLYLIADKDILWEREIEGNISQITVNKNGYVAVTIVDTVYKTVVELFDSQGTSLFKTIISSTRVVSTSISDDNKYLAIAQVDTSGTMIQSNIKVMSIDDAKNNTDNTIKKEYKGENNDLITNIKYQEKNKLLCMYTDKITEIKTDETVETIQEFKDKKISFASIELSNASITIEEKSSGLFTADSVVNIINSDNKSTSLYTAELVTKEIYTTGNIIALNLGAEVEFINTSGWLVKRYTAEQEITSIVISNSIAGIVYRDKIEIINL
ncbi:putative uncharacterized protein [Clostridium sp. CAG:389]|nr:putative uncharacterized protein [Clostridium sp. CAG:389]